MARILMDQIFDEERALYGVRDILLERCRFDGPKDGESALKEAKNIEVRDSYFNLRYPFWHDEGVELSGCEMTDACRAAFWYTNKAKVVDSKLYGIKAFRECADVEMKNCEIVSPEFGWSVRDICMKDCAAESEYFMLRSERLDFRNVSLKGKYSFQYIEDSVFEGCDFDTKDAFWHAKDITIRNSRIKGEYLAWYCENVTFENCTIIGTQPFCYCKNLRLIGCKMIDADLAFEKSEVEACISSFVESIKNPKKGTIRVAEVGEIIMDDDEAKGEVVVCGSKDCA